MIGQPDGTDKLQAERFDSEKTASGSFGKRMRQTVIHLIRGSIVKGGMSALLVVVADPFPKGVIMGRC